MQVFGWAARVALSFCPHAARRAESPLSAGGRGAARLGVWMRRREPRLSSSTFPLAQAKGLRVPMRKCFEEHIVRLTIRQRKDGLTTRCL